ncbi:hypothetical protein PV08_11156 [Exophiala spinifera]|uniref:Enoyl reductase (ER) domain-containing protein n=1 Tax=Exophiala spinifera TaxID=91928 RepID=A0A0D2AUL5_9EURO|nr:uncharacterized protein PV08_11156 [Exophiala spinifera]KIW10195.1 hypothetical protein PV08_11156 [Exophiala spinifera]
MKGVIFANQGADPKVVDTLERPKPGPDQLLVKSVFVAINPVDSFMSEYGLLVVSWPLVLGVDTGGIVVEAGEQAQTKYGFKAGDEVFGCTRLGSTNYAAGQEYFLMDARVTMHKPKNISLVQAATLGVAAETAFLGLIDGLKIPLPDPQNLPTAHDDWVIVLGGASSVGKCAIQLARACGYKVATSCSTKSAAAVKELGAIPFDYKVPLEEQVKAVMEITSGKVSKIFDAAAADDPLLAKELFKATNEANKCFATTNDWTGISDFEGGKTHLLKLGGVGRPEAEGLNAMIEQYKPVIVDLIEAGKLRPMDYVLYGEGGFDDAVNAYRHQKSGAAGSRKVVVKVQDP